jgi:hypothetical protein
MVSAFKGPIHLGRRFNTRYFHGITEGIGKNVFILYYKMRG